MANETRKLKTYGELTFADDFMFCKVLQNNPDLCKELTELILGQEIGEITGIAKQHPIEITADGHGVRFDIYMKDDRNTRYDIEMQTTRYPELPKRTRYYQSMIDADALEHSVSYSELPNSYVIFISLVNPFKKYGLHKYTFVSRCEEDMRIRLEDGARRIFISAKGSADDISDDMKSFLSYLTDQSTESDLTRRLEKAVRNAKERREWSVEYMTLYEKMQIEREEGRKEGLKEGIKKGLEEGVQKGLEEGVQKGLEEGVQKGQIRELIEMVQSGLVLYDVAAKRAEQKYHIREKDFRKMLDSRTK